MRHRFAALLLMGLGCLLGVVAGYAQGEPEVQYLDDQEVSSERLVEILGVTMRGVGRPTDITPECSVFLENTRGVRPVTDIAAFKILFAFDSAELRPEDARKLNELGEALKSDSLDWSCFRIEGHTDDVGTEAYNQSLSVRRAQAVVSYLTQHFEIEAERLIATGYGESSPFTANTTPEGRSENRRVQIANLGPGPE